MNAWKKSIKGDKLTKDCHKKIRGATNILSRPKSHDIKKEMNVPGLTNYSAPKQRYSPHLLMQMQPFIDHYREFYTILKTIKWKKLDCFVNHELVLESLCTKDLCNQVFNGSYHFKGLKIAEVMLRNVIKLLILR